MGQILGRPRSFKEREGTDKYQQTQVLQTKGKDQANIRQAHVPQAVTQEKDQTTAKEAGPTNTGERTD